MIFPTLLNLLLLSGWAYSQVDFSNNNNQYYFPNYPNPDSHGFWGNSLTPGNILDQSRNLAYNEKLKADDEKDRINPDQMHLNDVPKYLTQPQPVMYTMKNRNAVFNCRVTPVNHVSVICLNEKFTIGPNSRLSVERFNAEGQPDPEGITWDIKLEITNQMVSSTMNNYQCHCQAWNVIKEFNSAKFVDSQPSLIKEAYIDQDFVMEPVSANLTTGNSLTLSCQPPKGNPEPEVYWMKDGQRMRQDNQRGIIIDQYNHLVMENVRPSDSGNYSCVASILNKVFRYSNARVIITDPNTPFGIESKVNDDNNLLFDPEDFNNLPKSSPGKGSDLTRRDIALFAGLFCAGTAVFIFIGLALLVISRRANSSMPEKRFNANQRTLFIDPSNGGCEISKFSKLPNPPQQSQVLNFIPYSGGPPPHSQAPPPPPNSQANTYQVQSGLNNTGFYPPTYINCPKQVSDSVYQQQQAFNNACINHLMPLSPKAQQNNGKIINSSAPSTNSTIVMNSSVQSKLPPNGPDDYCLQQRNYHQNNYSLSGGSSGSNGSNLMYPVYPGQQQGYVTTSGTSASTEHSHYQEPIFKGAPQQSPNLLVQPRTSDNLNKSSSYVYDSVVLEHNYEDPNRQENPPSSL